MDQTYLNPALPGADMVAQGLADLATGQVSDFSLLLLAAAPVLQGLGVPVPVVSLGRPPHFLLYERLEERLADGAHSSYNSLMRRIVSYAHALEQVTANRIGT